MILEGPDGLGKSTFAAELSKRTGIPIYKPATAGVAPENITAATSQAEDIGAWGVILSTGVDVILDRAFPSEWVYGNVYGRGADIDDDLIWNMDRAAADAGVIGIMLSNDEPAANAIHAFLKARNVDDVNVIKWMEIRAGYKEYVARSAITWLGMHTHWQTNQQVMEVMETIVSKRPSKERTYMEIARKVSRRSTCLSRAVGAVLLSAEGHVIATGYNGAPAGLPHQTWCYRLSKNSASGKDLEGCTDVHAEENCIIQAAKSGGDPTGGTLITTSSPCSRCMRMLINAGIVEIVYDTRYDDELAFEMARMAHIDMERLVT